LKFIEEENINIEKLLKEEKEKSSIILTLPELVAKYISDFGISGIKKEFTNKQLDKVMKYLDLAWLYVE
jgi:hypothetical protein